MKKVKNKSEFSPFWRFCAASSVCAALTFSANMSACAADKSELLQIKADSTNIPAIIVMVLLAVAFAAIAVIIVRLFGSKPDVDCTYAEKTLKAQVISVLPPLKNVSEKKQEEESFEVCEQFEPITDTEPVDESVDESEAETVPDGEITAEVN